MIRRFQPADIDAIITLFRATVRGINRRDYTAAQVVAWAPDRIDRAAWLERFGANESLVSVLAGEIVGFAVLERTGCVDMMFVHEDRQGEGIATALLDALEDRARLLPVDRTYAAVSITARPFFERRGYTVTAPQTVELRGQSFVNYKMEKPLLDESR